MTTNGSSSLHVLLIDDDPGLLRLARLTLVAAGFTVVTATDGIEGLEQLESSSFDVILLDLQMPRMDGRAFYREMRSRGRQEPVLIASAFQPEVAQIELKAEGSVSKPFDPDDLVVAVQRVAGR